MDKTNLFQEEIKKTSPLLVQVASISACSSLLLLVGFHSGYDYHLLQRLEKYPTFSKETAARGWIEYMTPLSMIPGGIIGGLTMEIFGRTMALIILAIFSCFGWLVTAFAHNFHLLIIGRVATSVISGAMVPVACVYITEISCPKHRTKYLIGPVIAFNVGLLIMHLVGEFVSWKITSQVSAGLSTFFTIFIIFLIETPSYLVLKGQLVLALDSFKWFRGDSDSTAFEINELLDSRHDITIKLTIKDKIKIAGSLKFLEPIGFVSVLFILVQFCGLSNLIFHVDKVLTKIFDDMFPGITLTILVDCIILIGSVLALLLSHICKKRKIILIASFLTSMSLFSLSIFEYFDSIEEMWIECILLIMYSFCASILSALAWTFVGEIFSLDLRGAGSGLSSTIAYVFTLISVRVTPDVIFLYGTSVWFALTGCLVLICSGILCFTLPMTDELTLLEIEQNFSKNTNIVTQNTRL